MSNKEIIITEAEVQKWSNIVESEGEGLGKLNAIDSMNMVQLLENTANLMPPMQESTSLTDGSLPAQPATGTGLNPLLIGVLRRTMPTLMGTNWLGNHTLNSPNGMVMAMHVDQVDVPNDGSAKTSTEVWNANRPDVNHSGDGAGAGMADGDAERLGSTSATDGTAGGAVYQTRPWNEMAVRLSSLNVKTQSRALKAYLTHELIEDMQNMYGINAKLVLQNILKGQINAELDYEIFNYVQNQAKVGAQATTVAGTYDFATDADGRWAGEYYKHFSTFIDREANIVGRETRRGKANWMITSPDVASALSNISKFDSDTNIASGLNADKFTGVSYSGIYQNKFKVYVDPYATSDFVTIGFKGGMAEDAGGWFCPYSFRTVEATGEETFNPRIGVKMRYGMIHNPYASGAAQANPYFRTFNVANLI